MRGVGYRLTRPQCTRPLVLPPDYREEKGSVEQGLWRCRFTQNRPAETWCLTGRDEWRVEQCRPNLMPCSSRSFVSSGGKPRGKKSSISSYTISFSLCGIALIAEHQRELDVLRLRASSSRRSLMVDRLRPIWKMDASWSRQVEDGVAGFFWRGPGPGCCDD